MLASLCKPLMFISKFSADANFSMASFTMLINCMVNYIVIQIVTETVQMGLRLSYDNQPNNLLWITLQLLSKPKSPLLLQESGKALVSSSSVYILMLWILSKSILSLGYFLVTFDLMHHKTCLRVYPIFRVLCISQKKVFEISNIRFCYDFEVN